MSPKFNSISPLLPDTYNFHTLFARDVISCNSTQIVCDGRCIKATSNCCTIQGGWCSDGGTCYTKPNGSGSCCIPGKKCAASGGSTVTAPAIPTCTGQKSKVCGNSCIGADAGCCQGGAFCSGGGTCYVLPNGNRDACCIPGKQCVAQNGVTISASLASSTGSASASTDVATAETSSTASTTVAAGSSATDASSAGSSPISTEITTPSSSALSSQSSPAKASSSLSTGAQAGIGVGVAIIGLALLGLAVFYFKRRYQISKRPASAAPVTPSTTGAPTQEVAQTPQDSREYKETPTEKHELPATERDGAAVAAAELESPNVSAGVRSPEVSELHGESASRS